MAALALANIDFLGQWLGLWDPLGLLQSRLPQVRQRIQQLHGCGDHAAGERLFEEYREWLCPNDPHSDLLLMRRLAEGP